MRDIRAVGQSSQWMLVGRFLRRPLLGLIHARYPASRKLKSVDVTGYVFTDSVAMCDSGAISGQSASRPIGCWLFTFLYKGLLSHPLFI